MSLNTITRAAGLTRASFPRRSQGSIPPNVLLSLLKSRTERARDRSYRPGMADTTRRWWRRLELTVVPLWIAAPLAHLGASLAILYPIALLVGAPIAWIVYAAMLAVTTYAALSIRRKWEVRVLERSERGVVYWVHRIDATGSVPEDRQGSGPPLLHPPSSPSR
jgi:hypothetical protein